MEAGAAIARRAFQKMGAVGMPLLGLCAVAAFAGPSDILTTCKVLYSDKGTLAAYEYFTKDCGQGRAVVETPPQVQVGETVPETVVAFSAPEGIAPGGLVKLWCPNGATDPQLEHPDQPGFMQVETVVGHEVKLSRLSFREMYNQQRDWRFVDVALPNGLPPGGELLFRWRNVKVDERAGRFDGDHWRFQIAVDHDADGFAELIPNPPEVSKLAGPAVRLLARISSSAVRGEPVRLNVCAFDRFDNPASGYAGRLTLSCDQAGVLLPKDVAISAHGAAQCEVSFPEPGFYWIKVRSNDGMEAESNPVEVFASDPGMRLYWGDLHVHTEMSADARAGAHTVSSYDGSYRIGRYQYALDFQANSDHQGVQQGNYGSDDWETMSRITNEANEPGRFATLIAAELSGTKGDQIVYYAEAAPPFLDHDASNPKNREKDWEKLQGIECFTPPHHVCQSMRPWEWDVFNPALQPVCEIFSNHGRAEFFGNEPAYSGHGTATLEGYTWEDQLNAGKKLGAIANSDDHWARPGVCGLTGVWAPVLTRDAIYQGIKTRRCYATTGARAILHFSANGNGNGMGQEIECAEPPRFNVRAAMPGVPRKLEIIRNGEPVYCMEAPERVVDFQWQETELRDGYYYVRITLDPEKNVEASMKNRQQFVWSSPVWVSKNNDGNTNE